MPRDLERDLVGGDFIVERSGVAHGFAIELGKVEAGALCGSRQMVAKVPVLRSASDQLPDLVRKA